VSLTVLFVIFVGSMTTTGTVDDGGGGVGGVGYGVIGTGYAFSTMKRVY
jgi:hypothetical protein